MTSVLELSVPKPLITRTGNQNLLSGPVAKSTTRGGRLHTGRRSGNYLRALRALDGSGSLGTVDTEKFVDDIRREFHDRYTAEPLGIVGKCYLGEPFEVHTLTLDGSIIDHYRRGQDLPGGMERARTLAGSGTYLAIEVYADRLMCLHPDGTVVALGSGS
jgi:hypothetical protein